MTQLALVGRSSCEVIVPVALYVPAATRELTLICDVLDWRQRDNLHLQCWACVCELYAIRRLLYVLRGMANRKRDSDR